MIVEVIVEVIGEDGSDVKVVREDGSDGGSDT